MNLNERPMRHPGKLPGFTLSELLVVLLLTSVVVGLAFTVLQLVQRQMGGIQLNFETNTSFSLLEQSLWIDFRTADGVWYDSTTGKMDCVTGLRTVRYQWGTDYIIKERDTFALRLAEVQLFFEGEARQGGEIDALKLQLHQEQGGKSLFVYKRNAANTFLND